MPTIMVIEDDSVLSHLYDKVFTAAQMTVKLAKSCAEAIEQLQRLIPEIVLVDMSLDDGSGWQVVKWLRADPRFNATRVIVVSGNRQYEDELEAHGADCFLYKPVSFEMLLSLIGRFLAAPAEVSRWAEETTSAATRSKLGTNLSTDTGYVGWIANSKV